MLYILERRYHLQAQDYGPLTAEAPTFKPSLNDSSTDAVLPPINTRYFPRLTVPVFNMEIGDFFTMASPAITPVAMLLNSISAIAGYFFILDYPKMIY